MPTCLAYLCALHAYMPMCLVCLRAHIPTCLPCLRAHVSCVLTYSRANVSCMLMCSRANVSCVFTCSCVNMPWVLTCSHDNVPWLLTCQRALRTNWQLALHAHVQKVSTGGGGLISKLIEKTMRKKTAILKNCGMHKKLIYINKKRFLKN